MKKKVKKSLSLNKITVANLETKTMRVLRGGVYTDPGSTCKMCETADNNPFCQPTVTACQPEITDGCTLDATCMGLTCVEETVCAPCN